MIRIPVIYICLFIWYTLMFIDEIPAQESKNPPILVTDYSENHNWSILADSITHPIDVFYVHPTTYGPPSNGQFTAKLSNQKLNQLTDEQVVNPLTLAFSDNCNVFAPRYQQMNIEVLSMSEEKNNLLQKIPISDVTAAFEYYIAYLNNGRPFILASHSQGSLVLQMMILNNPGIINKEKLVAAYMPGWTFTDEIMCDMRLELSTMQNDNGKIIVWNTIGPGGDTPTISKGARCVNPLSWTTDTIEFPNTMNKGASIRLAGGTQKHIPYFTSAHINPDGTLEIPTPSKDLIQQLNMSMGPEVYHTYDYDFFFDNIKQNVAVRCNTYLKNHSE